MRRERKRASTLSVKVNDGTGCQPMPISWDATSGKAPWTVMIAPVNHVPYTMSVPSASGSSFTASWNVPKLDKDTQALVAVADSTGAVSGVSSFIKIAAASGSCTAMSDGLDFVWYPTKDDNSPAQCSDWGITWQQDKTNNGVQGQVSFTFLPEQGQPLTTAAGTGNKGSFKWTVPFDAGTKFLAIANDGGKAGTGGVGDLYSVSGGKSASKTCKAASIFGNGLPPPSATLSAATSSTSASSAPTGVKTAGSSAGPAASGTGSKSSSTADDSTSEHKSNTAGTAVGATFGVLGALALIGVLIWWLRKRRDREEHNAWGAAPKQEANANGGDAYNVSPWRWSAAPYQPPQTNSRASKWLGRASGTTATGFRVLGRGANEGHSRTGSVTTSSQPTMQQATFRNLSAPQNDYALSSMPQSDNFPRSPSPSQSARGTMGAQSIHSTVPDTALFPPPGPRTLASYDDGGYALARQQPQTWQQDSRGVSPFADPVPIGRKHIGAGVGAGAETEVLSVDSPVSEVRKGTSQSSSPASSSAGRNLLPPQGQGAATGNRGQGSEYIAPIGPTKTSIYDPYTHMSQIWDQRDGNIADRINQAGTRPAPAPPVAQNSFTRVNPPHVQRVNPPILSEVMMPQDGYAAKFSKTGPRKANSVEEEDEDGLPYL